MESIRSFFFHGSNAAKALVEMKVNKLTSVRGTREGTVRLGESTVFIAGVNRGGFTAWFFWGGDEPASGIMAI